MTEAVKYFSFLNQWNVGNLTHCCVILEKYENVGLERNRRANKECSQVALNKMIVLSWCVGLITDSRLKPRSPGKQTKSLKAGQNYNELSCSKVIQLFLLRSL